MSGLVSLAILNVFLVVLGLIHLFLHQKIVKCLVVDLVLSLVLKTLLKNTSTMFLRTLQYDKKVDMQTIRK